MAKHISKSPYIVRSNLQVNYILTNFFIFYSLGDVHLRPGCKFLLISPHRSWTYIQCVCVLYFHYKVSFNSSGITFAIFLCSLLYVLGHCISVHETGTIFIPDISDLAITTPSSFSAVVTRYPEEASPRLKTLKQK